MDGNVVDSSKEKAEHQEAGSKPSKVKKEKKPKAAEADASSHPLELSPPPAYIESRLKLWADLKAKYDAELAAKTPEPISITLPDGKVIEGQSWRSTPYQIAAQISQGLADNTIISKVDGKVWDLDRPLEGNCTLQLLKFDDPDAKAVFWHSTAHIMGEAMERHYGGCLCYGPPIEDGFYYDASIEGRQISSNDFPALENLMNKITKEKQPFERLEMTKEDLLKMFEYNKFKVRILNEKVTTPTTTVYRCGPLIDLCLGPHVRHTGKIKAFAVTKNSATYWEGKADMESLQRVYGISFPDGKLLKEWKQQQEEAALRDHRKLGRDYELFFFNELSPGSCFFYPKGAHIYNKLIELMRSEYRKRGFQEVITPNMFNSKLWVTSGHWEHYKDDMFLFEVEKEQFALKPMNCPSHCVMFLQRPRSWRELPLRYADFGALHRNELSGALTGLTRVRRFQQDDAHIFCTPEQITSEIMNALVFLKDIYDILGFELTLALSTRPDNFLGDIPTWDEAEKSLATALDAFGMPWSTKEKDGAFYGPKIDISVTDAMRRKNQCATIQLDFQLPIRFNLSYVTADEGGTKSRPVIIHRAILGSLERMIACLTENYAGKWPFWLSPNQVMIVPVASAFDEYGLNVRQQIWDAGFMVECDLDPGTTFNKKIRNAQLMQYNFILVCGEKEMSNKTVNVRTRDNVVHGEQTVDHVCQRLKHFAESRVREADEKF